MGEALQQPLTVAEFLDFDDGTETRYELVGGQPVAMSPPSGPHVEITMRLMVTLAQALRAPCRPIVTGGVARGLDETTSRLPDLFVTCAPTPPSGMFDQPRLIVEILSPSTEADDRSTKLDFYKTFPSLQAILLVWQDIRRIELHERGDDVWIVKDLIGSGRVVVDDPGLDLDMDEIYAD